MNEPFCRNEKLDELLNEYSLNRNEGPYFHTLSYLKGNFVFADDRFETTEYLGKIYYRVYTYITETMTEENHYFKVNIEDLVEIIDKQKKDKGIEFIIVENSDGKEFMFSVNYRWS